MQSCRKAEKMGFAAHLLGVESILLNDLQAVESLLLDSSKLLQVDIKWSTTVSSNRVRRGVAVQQDYITFHTPRK
jgi:hypothetical protein